MSVDPESWADLDYSEFTEASYAEMLRLAQGRYRFATYRERPASPHVLWRHDVDCSMHRAVALARLEARAGVVATYFLYPRSLFYNLLSREAIDCVRDIEALGHRFGLHFDPTFYGETVASADVVTGVADEKALLEQGVKVCLDAVSFHLYGVLKSPMPDDDEIAGLVNAYGSSMRCDYEYVSDSNGLWRFRSLREVLENPAGERLHVLTHPVWWTPQAMAPRARVQRCIDGYARAIGESFDQIVVESGRPNIR